MKYGIFGIFLALTLSLGGMAAWLTHCIWIIKALSSAAGATAGQMVLGVLGAFLPPIGVIHGIVLWLT